ncbi:MAG: ChrR family anti-sigma-E factor [Kiloniellaceae bacterium]
MPDYHPGPELLMDYASGALPEPVALFVASHVSLCRACQDEVARLEALGGALFDELEGEPLGEEALDRALARLEVPEGLEAPPPACGGKSDARVPGPLGGYLASDLDSLPWKKRGSVAEFELLSDYPGIRTRLLRIKAGTALPQHTHEGTEYTLLLAGGFTDDSGHYRRGDVAVADASVDHRPVADPGEDCICLAVIDAPLRLTGRLGRYFNFLARL